MPIAGSDMLSWFEVPRPLIEPTLRALRLGNTALDALFYDVSALVTDLLLHGSIVVAEAEGTPSWRISEMTARQVAAVSRKDRPPSGSRAARVS